MDGLSEGARLLLKHLERTGTSLHAFCERAGLEYSHAHKLLSGTRGARTTVNFAVRVFLQSKGEIPFESWSDTETLELWRAQKLHHQQSAVA